MAGWTRRESSPARQFRQAHPEPAVAARQLAPVERAQLPDPQDAVGGEPALHRTADPPQPADRLVGEKAGRLGPADHRETARLVEIGGELGKKLVVAEADRDRYPERRLDPPGERGEGLRRRYAMHRGRSAQVEKRLIDRERFDERGQAAHLGPHGPADFAIFRHVRADHDRIGAGSERLEHRHRRAHAVEPRDIAAGQHDAARAAADDHRAFGQFLVSVLLDCRVEGVAVQMGEREIRQFGVRDDPRRAAFRAAGRRCASGTASARSWASALQSRHSTALIGQRRCPVGAGLGGHSQAAPRTPLASP